MVIFVHIVPHDCHERGEEGVGIPLKPKGLKWAVWRKGEKFRYRDSNFYLPRHPLATAAAVLLLFPKRLKRSPILTRNLISQPRGQASPRLIFGWAGQRPTTPEIIYGTFSGFLSFPFSTMCSSCSIKSTSQHKKEGRGERECIHWPIATEFYMQGEERETAFSWKRKRALLNLHRRSQKWGATSQLAPHKKKVSLQVPVWALGERWRRFCSWDCCWWSLLRWPCKVRWGIFRVWTALCVILKCFFST